MLDFQRGEINVIVPTLLEYEIANVLWVKQREGISKEKAVEISTLTMKLVFVILNEVKNLVMLNGKRFFAGAQNDK